MIPENRYRVRRFWLKFQPEMRYWIKGGERWVPLNAEGYWAEPECFSTGIVTQRSLMTKREAEQAVWKARGIDRTTVFEDQADAG